MIKTGVYNAIVARVSEVKEHPNADRLELLTVLGYQVISSKGLFEKGDIGILFPEGGRLSREMGLHNQLYRIHPDTGEKMSGYFCPNLRVKTTRLRAEFSEAFFTSLDSLDWIPNLPELGEGTEFCEINGKEICKKYHTQATLRAMKQAAKQYRKPWWVPSFLTKYHKQYIVNRKKFDPCPDFHEHFKTNKLRMSLGTIPEAASAIFSAKRHGTSGRTGFVPYDTRNWWQKLLRFAIDYHYVTGTRKTVKNPIRYGKTLDDGFYSGTDFRQKIHNQIAEIGLKKGEILYYEILGWANETTPIMPDHHLKWEDFKKEGFSKEQFQELVDKYGETVTYHYGNAPGEFSFEVYRITQDGKDLSYAEMVSRCFKLGLKTVPFLGIISTDEDLMEHSKYFSEQSDEGDQLREGVCVRIQKGEKLQKILKYKGTIFCVLESIKSNDSEYIDLEAAS